MCSVRNTLCVAVIVMAAASFLSPANVCGAERISAYAPPLIWGEWQQASAHVSAITYKISARPVGNTTVVGQVTYYDKEGQKTREFYGSTSFRVDGAGVVNVRFKSLSVTGSFVKVEVEP